jgi:hypothetical protein
MVAVLDSKRKSFFVIENANVRTGAKAISLHSLWHCSEEAQISNTKFDLDDKRFTWLACPHLVGSDRVYEYYMSSGLIIIVHGKCFCGDCLDMILFKRDLSDFVHSSIPMTDRLFQENFVNPLI